MIRKAIDYKQERWVNEETVAKISRAFRREARIHLIGLIISMTILIVILWVQGHLWMPLVFVFFGYLIGGRWVKYRSSVASRKFFLKTMQEERDKLRRENIADYEANRKKKIVH